MTQNLATHHDDYAAQYAALGDAPDWLRSLRSRGFEKFSRLGFTRAAPDVAVEVLSPSTAAIDRGRKMRMFARYGVPEYWIVDPLRRRIEIHVLDPETRAWHAAQTAGNEDTVRSVLLPGLAVDAARIFPPP